MAKPNNVGRWPTARLKLGHKKHAKHSGPSGDEQGHHERAKTWGTVWLLEDQI